MPQLEFTLENLHQLDRGRAARAWNSALRRIMHDLHGRKGDDRKRSIVLKLDLAPTSFDEKGNVETVAAAFKVKTSVPDQETGSVLQMSVAGKEPMLSFASESPEAPAQTDFGDIDPLTGEVIAVPRLAKQA